MAKFHITDDGPRPCAAQKRACPVGGEHFESVAAAEAAYAATLGHGLTAHRKSTFPATTVEASVEAFGGGHYFGCHVPAASVQPYLDAFREEVGSKAPAMEELKAARDRGTIYHLTTIGPPEMKKLKGKVAKPPADVKLTYVGVGKAEDNGHEAWFIVCESDQVQEWRATHGLPPKDLHITLGFSTKDVHTQPKGRTSLVIL